MRCVNFQVFMRGTPRAIQNLVYEGVVAPIFKGLGGGIFSGWVTPSSGSRPLNSLDPLLQAGLPPHTQPSGPVSPALTQASYLASARQFLAGVAITSRLTKSSCCQVPFKSQSTPLYFSVYVFAWYPKAWGGLLWSFETQRQLKVLYRTHKHDCQKCPGRWLEVFPDILSKFSCFIATNTAGKYPEISSKIPYSWLEYKTSRREYTVLLPQV